MQTVSRRSIWIPMVGVGALWAAIVLLRMLTESPGSWRWRDDAVITLSHARNWVEFGTIGVSPGDRVEGFSAPLQFLLASGVFSLAPMGFELFLDSYVLVFLFLTGAFVTGSVLRVLRMSPARDRRVMIVGVILSLAAAVPVAASWSASGWLVSGMENPMITAISAAIVFVALGSVHRTSTAIGLGVLLALLGLTRIEMPVLLIPLLLALVWLLRRGRWWLIVAIPVITWSIFHALRWITYGELLPNTAIVQGKSAGSLQIAALIVYSGAAFALLAALWRWGGDRRRLTALWSVFLGFLILSLAYVLASADGTNTWFGPYWMPDPGYLAIWLSLIVLAVAQILRIRQSTNLAPWAPEMILASVSLLPIIQYLVMGPARLDAFRVASIAVPMVTLWTAITIARLFTNPAARSTTPALLIGIAALVTSTWVWIVDSPRALCCDITENQTAILAVADEIRSSSLGAAALPIIANPDLGKVSFTKRGLITDLGLLGDPLLTRVMTERPDLMPTYMNEVTAPDVVEMHGGWACDFNPWVQTTFFQENWKLTETSWIDLGLQDDAQCPNALNMAIWDRVNSDSEYALTRSLLTSQTPTEIARQAIQDCVAKQGSVFRCQGVRRAIQRTAEVLKENGTFESVVTALDASPTFALDKELLIRDPGWARRAFALFLQATS